ncbi:MAG: type II toxin-antitoxin system HicB family antitoxin [Lachnospiraceae bacterium]|nr:type II toxin-antitoxin system HicB family antitoxin [Lachnospiraceae bacterium]
MREDYIYPIKVKEEEGVFLITFPDFPDQMTDTNEESKVIRSAQEVLSLCIIDNENQGIENPAPSSESEIQLDKGERIVYVHLWMPYFRNITKEIYVKKTLTIPQWLDLLAKDKNVNFSAVLVSGLKQELGIGEKNK